MDAHGLSTTGTQTVTVVDTTPPTLTAPADVTVEAASPGPQPVVIGTHVAHDVFAFTVTNDAPSLFPYGTTVVTWKATDVHGLVATDTQTVTVVDTVAPSLSVSDVPLTLSPPNRKMVRITPTLSVGDAADASPTVTVSVTSNEPDDGLGNADAGGDIVVHSPTDIELRAERDGSGTGRVYTLVWTALDSHGNSSVVTKAVSVPRPGK